MPTKTKRKPEKRDTKAIQTGADRKFAEMVEEAMRKHDMSETALSKGTGVPRGTINRWLSGKRRLFSEDLAKLFDFLSIKVKGYGR